MSSAYAYVVFGHGFLPVHLPLDGFAAASGIKDAATCRFEFLKDTFFKEWPKAIYQVKSKSGVLHFVYFDGCSIWDGALNAPVYPEFSDYDSIVDVVYLLPNTPFSIYRNTDEITAFSDAHLQRHKEWIESSDDSNEKTAAQKVADYEVTKPSLKLTSMTDPKTGITLRISSFMSDAPLEHVMGRL